MVHFLLPKSEGSGILILSEVQGKNQKRVTGALRAGKSSPSPGMNRHMHGQIPSGAQGGAACEESMKQSMSWAGTGKDEEGHEMAKK